MAAASGTLGPTNCPLITPFDESGVDTDALSSLVDALLERGLGGFVPCGTTGEFASLSENEYRAVLETTVEAAGDRAPVLAGAAATTIDGTLDRLETAAATGATAGLITLPYFHGANDPAGDERFLQAIAAESPLPIYLYNLPSCVGRAIPVGTIEALADEETIVGCKDTSGDFEYFLTAQHRTPDSFSLLQGYDAFFVPGLLEKSAGGINALTNAIPEPFVSAVDAIEAGEYERARAIQATEISPLFEACSEHGFAPAAKVAAAARGFVPDTAVRPPLVEIDDDGRTEIEARVENALTNYE